MLIVSAIVAASLCRCLFADDDSDGSDDEVTVLWMQVLSNGSLAVSEVYMEDSGMYGCTAENSGGPRRTEVYLHVTSAYPLMRHSASVS